MEKYYIRSNKYSTQERQTKCGRVYDIAFRIVTKEGKEKQKKLSGFKTKGAAREAYLEFVQEHCELAKGNVIKQLTAPNADSDITLEQLIEVYITSLNNQNKDSSIYDKRNVFRLFIVPKLGKVKLHELTKELLYKWQDELWATKNPKTNDYYSYKYLSNIRTYLSALLSWASERYNYDNPLPKIKKPKRRIAKTEMQFWTQDEFKQFIANVTNPTHHAIFSMLFYTGRRKGEVIALQKEDVTPKGIKFNKTYSRKTLDGSAYKITSTKNESSGLTPICTPLRDELSRYEAAEPFFFGGDSPIHENTIAHAFERYTAKAGVKPIRIHDLRHSFVSMCIHLGASVYVVADLIGDTVEQVLKTYGHLYDSDKLEIIAKIS